jgi:hypothetical protein
MCKSEIKIYKLFEKIPEFCSIFESNHSTFQRLSDVLKTHPAVYETDLDVDIHTAMSSRKLVPMFYRKIYKFKK